MSAKSPCDSVLVIDDDADFRELLITIGQLAGVPVLTASDCCEGLKILSAEPGKIKMIFLDYFIPGMDAKACASAIRAKAGPLVPVVLVTAAPDPGQRASQLHISRWIAKPLDVSVLSALLTESSTISNTTDRL